MGWTSGTEIFDRTVKKILESSLIENEKIEIISELFLSLRDRDWDTVCESVYFYDPIIKQVVLQYEPEWYDEE